MRGRVAGSSFSAVDEGTSLPAVGRPPDTAGGFSRASVSAVTSSYQSAIYSPGMEVETRLPSSTNSTKPRFPSGPRC